MVIGKKQELVYVNLTIHIVALEATITIPYNYQDVNEICHQNTQSKRS